MFFTHMEIGVPSVLPSNVPESLHRVRLFARRDDGRLPRRRSRSGLNIRFGEFEAGRTTIHHHADATAVIRPKS